MRLAEAPWQPHGFSFLPVHAPEPGKGARILKVVIVHNEVGEVSTVDERDVLDQVDVVLESLNELGHDTDVIPCSLDLIGLKENLAAANPDLIFNLVESVDRMGSLIHLAPALFDSMGFAYTGSNTEAIFLTSNKVLAKNWMSCHGIDTPDWKGPTPGRSPLNGRPAVLPRDSLCIIKSTWEHASFNLEAGNIVFESDKLDRIMCARAPELGGSCFAEQFVDGREFNITMLAHAPGVDVLPPAELLFEDFPEHTPHIIGYRAKWEPESFEYTHTPGRVDFSPEDAPLLERLEQISRRCWKIFGLSGYARIDFRVDGENRPMVLEVNANPCLSPDAGFAAAIERADCSFTNAVQRIIDDAVVPDGIAS